LKNDNKSDFADFLIYFREAAAFCRELLFFARQLNENDLKISGPDREKIFAQIKKKNTFPKKISLRSTKNQQLSAAQPVHIKRLPGRARRCFA